MEVTSPITDVATKISYMFVNFNICITRSVDNYNVTIDANNINIHKREGSQPSTSQYSCRASINLNTGSVTT
jgi:hypothetical protein